jgi:hypothetical protein
MQTKNKRDCLSIGEELNFVSHVRYEFMKVGDAFVNIHYMCPVSLGNMSAPPCSAGSTRCNMKALVAVYAFQFNVGYIQPLVYLWWQEIINFVDSFSSDV